MYNKINKIFQQAENLSFYFPALLIYGLVIVASVFYGFYISLTDWGGIRQSINFIGLENYIDAFKDPRLYEALKNISIFTVVYTVLHSVIGLLVAKAFIQNTTLNNIFKAAIFAPYIISILCISYIWNYIYTPINGILNNILMGLGILKEPLNWLGSERLALWSVLLTLLWYATGFTFVIYLAGLKGIPICYYEAADIDGANWWKKFFFIDIPLLRPVIKVVLVIDIIACFKLFDVFFIMTKGGPGYATDTVTTLIFREAFTNSRMAYATAISSILFVIILLVIISQSRIMGRFEREK